MGTLALLLGCILLLASPVMGQAATQSSGTVTMEFDLSAQDAGDETKLWIPHPLSDADQTITDISVSYSFS